MSKFIVRYSNLRKPNQKAHISLIKNDSIA